MAHNEEQDAAGVTTGGEQVEGRDPPQAPAGPPQRPQISGCGPAG